MRDVVKADYLHGVTSLAEQMIRQIDKLDQINPLKAFIQLNVNNTQSWKMFANYSLNHVCGFTPILSSLLESLRSKNEALSFI
jgi:hypothetical protein